MCLQLGLLGEELWQCWLGVGRVDRLFWIVWSAFRNLHISIEVVPRAARARAATAPGAGAATRTIPAAAAGPSRSSGFGLGGACPLCTSKKKLELPVMGMRVSLIL